MPLEAFIVLLFLQSVSKNRGNVRGKYSPESYGAKNHLSASQHSWSNGFFQSSQTEAAVAFIPQMDINQTVGLLGH